MGAQSHSIAFGFFSSYININIEEFLMKRIGSPENDNLHAFSANCRESPVRSFRKKTPLSVCRCEGGRGVATELRELRKMSIAL